jgi:DNA repair photolyase
MSSVTDPYHGIEAKYKLTRGILEVLVNEQYPGSVGILTKSPMVLRDVDLLKQLPDADVGMTITTTDDKLSRFLEVTAPLASRRFDTLRRLNEEGLRTYAFVGPLLPHFRYQPELLEKLFSELASTGVREIYVEHINLPNYVKERMWEVLRNESDAVQDVYREAKTQKHRQILDEMISELVAKYGFRLRLDDTLYHKDLA